MHWGKALLCRRDVSLLGASGFELRWGPADLRPDVTWKNASLCLLPCSLKQGLSEG